MMYCGYHAKNPAVVQCNQCARWLCPACDHRVRGFPFCQDCIVAGVELLRHHSSANPAHILRRKSSPFIATLLSFVPGLGAAYNGQTSKAIVHFAIFASFFQMAVVTQGMHFFILGVIGTWLFAAVDACRTEPRCGRRCDCATSLWKSAGLGHDADHHRHAVPVAHVIESNAAD